MYDLQIKRAVTAKGIRGFYDLFDAGGRAIGSFGYNKADPHLPTRQFFCSWGHAEEAEIEIYDPEKSGKWRYDIQFTPDQISFASARKHMNAKLAVRIYNHIMRTTRAKRGEITRYS